jgi:CHASE3 domain sensor protein
MRRAAQTIRRATLGLWLVSTATAALAIGCYLSVRRTLDQGDQALVWLTDDILRASQAKVAAERMVALGRGYLLTSEPESLARAQAAETKLDATLQSLATSRYAASERESLARIAMSARKYHEAFAATVTSGSAASAPRAMAEALRTRLLPARDRLEVDLDELIAREQLRATSIRSDRNEHAWRSVGVILFLGLGGAVVCGLCAWTIMRYLRWFIAETSGRLAQRPARPVVAPTPDSPLRERSAQDVTAERSPRSPGEPAWWQPL